MSLYEPSATRPRCQKPTENVSEIIAALMWAPRTRAELQEISGASFQSVDRWLRVLHGSGVIRVSGHQPRAPTEYGGASPGRGHRQWAMQAIPFGAPDA